LTARPGAPVVVAWAELQPRSRALAAALGGEAAFLASRLPRGPLTAPMRYLAGAVRTWRLLERRRPACVVAVTPPVAAPLAAWLWCRAHGRPLVVDCHTDAFHGGRWAWARPLHRWLFRRSRVALVHTAEALALVRGWGAPGLLLPDDLPGPDEAEARPPASRPTVLVAGSLDPTEPVAEALAAAALLPDVQVRVTGDMAGVPAAVRRGAPPNVVFTGFLAYPAFLGEMLAADVVAVFSTDPHIMNRAAFEAAGLGRPLVLSDLAGLRERFGAAALFAGGRPEAMAVALREALRRAPELAERTRLLAGELRAQHAAALAELRARLAAPAAPRPAAPAPRRVLRITQHPYPADSIVRRDVEELTARGFDVDVVCAPPAPTPGRDDAGVPGPRVYTVPLRHRRGGLVRYALEYVAFFAAAFAAASVLGVRRRYAAVQVDNLPDTLVFAAAVPRLLGARLVLTLYELTPEMVAARFEGRLGAGVAGVARAVEAAAVRWAHHVIVVSRPCQEALLARGVPAERMSVVLNTTPWQGHRPPPAPERAASQCLVTHTTLVERYGVHVAVQALSRLRPAWPDLWLRVLGDGEQLPALRRLAEDLGLADRVVFTGRLPWSETLAEVSGARLGLVPILADGYGQLLLPTKLLEYAWLGVPAVCSRLPAIEAYFPPGALAYAAPGDAADLAAQVDRLLRDPPAAEAQAARAAAAARDLAWERNRDVYLAALGLDKAPSPLAGEGRGGGWEGAGALTARSTPAVPPPRPALPRDGGG
jgi:glycosyltransferase involved in cell wall biosynthesis